MTDTKVKKLHTNVEEISTESNTENVKRETIDNTPFTIISIDDNHFGTMGEYRITETQETKEQVREILNEFNWNRLIQVCLILMDINNKDNKLINQIKKESK